MALQFDDADKAKIIEWIKEGFSTEEIVKAVKDSVRQIVPGMLKPVEEKASGFERWLREEDERRKKKEAEGKEGEHKQDDNETARLRAEVQKLQRENEARDRQAREKDAQIALQRKKDRFIAEAKSLEGGFVGERSAFEYLKDRLDLGEDGESLTVKVQRDGYVDTLPVKKFLTDEFSKDPEGKIHFPAKGAGGGGGGGGGGDQDRVSVTDYKGGKLSEKDGAAMLKEVFGR